TRLTGEVGRIMSARNTIPKTVQVSVNGQSVPVIIHENIIPADKTEAEIWEWATEQANQARAGRDDGVGRYSAQWPGGPWTWVRRVWHESGAVEIFLADGNG
ncbi:MAG TPA: hypothetical protein VER17_06290, partial [Tepidisphaeraceae bacterium]|nr:hypothetical protein [Tepidisphaeraceae bacterium]